LTAYTCNSAQTAVAAPAATAKAALHTNSAQTAVAIASASLTARLLANAAQTITAGPAASGIRAAVCNCALTVTATGAVTLAHNATANTAQVITATASAGMKATLQANAAQTVTLAAGSALAHHAALDAAQALAATGRAALGIAGRVDAAQTVTAAAAAGLKGLRTTDPIALTDALSVVLIPGTLTRWNSLPPALPARALRHIVVISGIDGVALYQINQTQTNQLTWGRQLRDVSTCTLTIPPLVTADQKLPDIVPWLHWVHVYDAPTAALLWSGPIQNLSTTRTAATITAKDVAALMTRTRNPITKSYDNTDPVVPAADMWNALIEQHNLPITPIVNYDPYGGRYEYAVTADSAMMDQAISDLVGMGLYWTVVAGTPILGPAPKAPIMTLGENDFIGSGIEWVRDGASVYNDILLRGPDNLARARVTLYGLELQQIVKVDSMFGVSNVNTATAQYATYYGAIRDAIQLPNDTVVNPQTPLAVADLIPSTRFTISAFGMNVKMELEAMTVDCAAGTANLSVSLESVIDPPDLPELAQVTSAQSVGATTTTQTTPAIIGG